MSTFYLVRHGAKEKVMGDPPLSEIGVKQAELTGKLLKQFSITAIYSSPLLRAQQTAKIIGQELGLSLLIDERLKERMNWGDKKDETFEEFLNEWNKASRDRSYQPIHGDSAKKTGERLQKVLVEAELKYKNQSILVVTHGGTIGDFLKNIFSNLTFMMSPIGVSYIKIIECSITTIRKEEDQFILEKIGDISHLPEPLI